MAIAFRAAGTVGSVDAMTAVSPGSLSAGMPAGVTAGDVLLAFVAHGNQNMVITPPAGWTSIRNTVQSTVPSCAIRSYYRIADGTEPGSYSWGWSLASGSGRLIVRIAAFSGVDSPYIHADTGQVNSAAPFSQVPSVTTSVDDAMVVLGFVRSTVTFATPPAGTTEWADHSGSSGNQATFGSAYFTQGSAGATGTKNFTHSAGSHVSAGQAIALGPPISPFDFDPDFIPSAAQVFDAGMSLNASPEPIESTAQVFAAGMGLNFGPEAIDSAAQVFDPGMFLNFSPAVIPGASGVFDAGMYLNFSPEFILGVSEVFDPLIYLHIPSDISVLSRILDSMDTGLKVLPRPEAAVQSRLLNDAEASSRVLE